MQRCRGVRARQVGREVEAPHSAGTHIRVSLVDYIGVASAISLRSFTRLGSAVSIVDFLQLGSSLALRSFARYGPRKGGGGTALSLNAHQRNALSSGRVL